MVQKNPQGRWKVTGKVIRVAQRGKIVTNQHRGGKVYPLNTILSCYYSRKNREMYSTRLNKLGLGVAVQLQKTYTRLKEIGIDVAPDQNKKPWILEVNTRPGIIVFRKLKDKRMYRKMIRYGRVYGRRY
jgi:glutathione synthase/RimK-type ligase-like ATP-grasp enzyme